MAGAARTTSVMSGIAYPSAIFGVPRMTFLGLWFLVILSGWLINLWFKSTLSILVPLPLLGFAWISIARKYARNPHVENQWRTAAAIHLARLQRARVSPFPGRRLIPTTLPCRPDSARGGVAKRFFRRVGDKPA